METNASVQPYAIAYDLENCDQEPIQFIRFVQQHACLLSVNLESLKITQATDNTAQFLNVPLDTVLQAPLSALLPTDIMDTINQALAAGEIEQINPLPLPISPKTGERRHLILHQQGNQLIIEVEALQAYASSTQYFNDLERVIQELQKSRSLQTLYHTLAISTKSLTGFDRVMIYRFDEKWNGQVVAEAKEPQLESYLHLRYPASDIPAQARALFLRNRVRVISDVGAKPTVLYPATDPGTGQPLDLSDAVARGSSPIHLEYLSNMGVQASLTVAIVVGEQLWGLIACHHYQPHFVDFRVRNMIKFLGQIASGQLVMQLSNDFKTQQLQTEKVRAQLFEALSQNWDIQEVIQQRDPGLLDLVDAGGAAIYFGETLKTLGDTPPATEIQGLIQELDRLKRGGVFATRSCQNEPLLAGVELPNTVGVLVLCISLAPYECMIWFRPEVREEVLWGGNPSKAVVHTEKGRRLSPRESFEKWKEVVEGQSRPWKSYELEVARSFGEDVKEVIIQKFNELKRLNAELSAAYEDLETFSYTVSHDLRAPLRGIAGFVDILREDYVEGFDERGHELMQTIIDNVGKMNAFITDILALARIGRHGLILNELPVRQIIHQIWEDRTAILPADRQVEFCLPDSMPSVVGDYTLLQQLFENILSNAIKYSQFESPARIEVDYTEDSQSVTYSIKDNGVGFDMKYADRIFEVFHRLVSDEDFKGTGIGLAIAKKVVSQHKGWIWVDSSPGVGTTFYIKLPKRVINQ